MWHKPCRTFHPWCPCIKTRCLYRHMTVEQQAVTHVTRANVNPDLCRHMTSLNHNELLITKPLQLIRRLGISRFHLRPGYAIFNLTHWGRDKMDAISQTTLSNAFPWRKIYKFRFRFHWSLFARSQLTIFQHWFRQWLGAGQATSHYLNQCWYVLLTHTHVYA